jgi:hypothetical protein
LYNVVGIGEGAKNLIESFEQYREYKTYHLGEDVLGDFSSMADYESNFSVTAVKKVLKDIDENSEVLYIVEGGGDITGVSLRILDILKKASVTILYIVPDRSALNEQERENEDLTFRAFQDIVRSGALKQIILIDLERVETFLGDIPLENYDKVLAHNIVNTFAMLNYFDHIDPVKTTKKKLPVAVRISTLGLLNSEEEEFMFYDLKHTKDKEYCYGVTDKEMKKSSLLREVRNKIKSASKETRCYYSIYLIDSEENQKYIRAHTDICQVRNEKIDGTGA